MDEILQKMLESYNPETGEYEFPPPIEIPYVEKASLEFWDAVLPKE